MRKMISIIVPVFNLESLLPKCIDSILTQTFTEFELILVNDGSTDKSGDICDRYASYDQRVKVIHTPNRGVSAARNIGLEIAEGDYVCFVDSDDYINQHMYEILYLTALKSNADITICSYVKVFEEEHHQPIAEHPIVYREEHTTNIEALHQMYKNKDEYISYVVPWNKLYKRNLFNNIKYEVGNIYDDESVAHKLLYKSKKITYIDAALYYYLQRNGSQMNSPFHIKRFDKIYTLNERVIYFKQLKEVELHEKALKHFMDMFFWYYFLAKENLVNIDHELNKMKQLFDKSLVYLLRHKHISWKQKCMCILFSIRPALFILLKDRKV